MLTRLRFGLVGVPQHIVQCGFNRDVCFFADEDYLFYLQSLREAARSHACRVHAYVLMPDHMHLLATPRTRGGFASMLQTVRDHYAQYIRQSYQRNNALWDGRYKACFVQPERHLLDCCRYIELNPVRAGLVKHPANYRWSSHAFHALGVADELITEHAQYRLLGKDDGERHQAYRELIRSPLEPDVFKAINTALNDERVLGDELFRKQIEIAQKRQLSLAEARQLLKPDIGRAENRKATGSDASK